MMIRSLVVIAICTATAHAQVLNLHELNTKQITSLDRSKTVVIIPGGILEEHGPYLPSGTDTLFNERMARDLAEAIVARPGWTAVLFPTIPLGASGANDIGAKFSFPGTYAVRTRTLRQVYMDLAAEFGDQGFRWIFLVHNHGAPNHHLALNQAAEFFEETFGGTMVHLFGIEEIFLCCLQGGKFLGPEQRAENGFSVHAGASEHSSVLFLRPDLVSPEIARAPSVTGRSLVDLERIARTPDWPGYFGAPRFASAAQGAAEYRAIAAAVSRLALEILDGREHRNLKRYSDVLRTDPDEARIEEASRVFETTRASQQAEWLRKKGYQ